LDWRTECDLVDSNITELGLSYTPPTLDVDTLIRRVDNDTTRMCSVVQLLSSVLSNLRTSILDKCTRRKRVTRNTDFFMGGLKQESNTKRHPVLLCKFAEKGI
jgi:hypothetical protein